MKVFILLLLGMVLLSVCYTDITNRKIKNKAVAMAALLSALLSVTSTGSLNLLYPLIVLTVGFLLVFVNMIGAGDIKLIAALSLSVPAGQIPEFILWITLSGVPLILVVVVLRLVSPASKTMTLPYGVAISIGYLLHLLG